MREQYISKTKMPILVFLSFLFLQSAISLNIYFELVSNSFLGIANEIVIMPIFGVNEIGKIIHKSSRTTDYKNTFVSSGYPIHLLEENKGFYTSSYYVRGGYLSKFKQEKLDIQIGVTNTNNQEVFLQPSIIKNSNILVVNVNDNTIKCEFGERLIVDINNLKLGNNSLRYSVEFKCSPANKLLDFPGSIMAYTREWKLKMWIKTKIQEITKGTDSLKNIKVEWVNQKIP